MSEAPEALAARVVRERIAAAAERAGRDPAGVTLVAATKGVPPERIRSCGLPDAGENRVQDLLAKQAALEGDPIRWHFIGVLQANKAKAVAGRVFLIHSIDTAKLGRAVGRRATEAGGSQDVLVEVNTSGEASKAGCAPDALPDLLAALAEVPGLAVKGLMTVPAPGSEAARAAFRRLEGLRAAHGLEHCSMGMSDDFEVAVAEGATIVRVGTAIFGPRGR